jgi:TonB family protein
VFVLSTENSGGGLPSFGVFSNQQVYTVFLDMRETEHDRAIWWTLEFAVDREAPSWANVANQLDEGEQGLVLPFPIVKEKPAPPLDLVQRHTGEMVIVFAQINIEGKIEQISVKQSPDPGLNDAVLEALGRWVFKPAVLNGNPVAVKTLLGIPLE